MVFPDPAPGGGTNTRFSLAAGGFLATIFTLGLGVAGIPGGFLFDRCPGRPS